jgi:hypothetical protein
MSDPCRTLKSTDPQAAGLCHLLTQEMGVPLESIDKGVPYIRCTESKCQMQMVEGTAGNGIPEAGEVYEASIALLEREEDAFAASDGKTERRFTDLVSTTTTFHVPWLYNDFNPNTHHDDRLLLSTAKKIREIKQKIRDDGKKDGTYAFNRELLKHLVSWKKGPKSPGVVRVDFGKRELTLIQCREQPKGKCKGDCTELSRDIYADFRLATLNTAFIDVQRTAYDPQVKDHNAVGVRLNPLDPDRITTVDLYYGVILKRGHLMQSEMPAISALAAYNSNLATLLMTDKDADRQRDTERIENLFLEAIRYDPYHATVHNNYANFLDTWKGDRKGACAEAKKASQLRHDYQLNPDYENFCNSFTALE